MKTPKKMNPEQPTWGQLVKHLFAVIRWRVSPKKWIGKRFYLAGKMRTVISETYDHVFVSGMQNPIRKDSRYFYKK